VRSTAGLKKPGAWIFLFTLSAAAILSTHAFSASKVKPELPIGEELEEPAAASAPSAPKKPIQGSDKPAPAANPTVEKTAPAPALNAQQGEEKDPYAAPPQGLGKKRLHKQRALHQLTLPKTKLLRVRNLPRTQNPSLKVIQAVCSKARSRRQSQRMEVDSFGLQACLSFSLLQSSSLLEP